METNIEKLIALYSYGQTARPALDVSDEACGTIVMESMLDVEGLSTKLFALSISAAIEAVAVPVVVGYVLRFS